MNLKGVREKHTRSVLKAISWRIVASSITMSLVYILTGQLELTAGVGIGEVILKIVFYFLHERGWNRISFGRSLHGTIESVMRSPPVTALLSSSALDAVRKMIASDIGSIIITDGKSHYGLVTEKDILGRVLEANRDPAKTPLKEIMSSPLIAVEQNQSLAKMLKTMHEKQVRRLAVVDEGEIVGIITERRILEALI
ncbi:MAG: CBS domain-containing protein [Candidatus Bathyarchaeota archaeon]|nr:MAG: CBS domain-containing protein [Candidatus Bathyarchaeota archaeon]